MASQFFLRDPWPFDSGGKDEEEEQGRGGRSIAEVMSDASADGGVGKNFFEQQIRLLLCAFYVGGVRPLQCRYFGGEWR